VQKEKGESNNPKNRILRSRLRVPRENLRANLSSKHTFSNKKSLYCF
jgi:hypothetical protein